MDTKEYLIKRKLPDWKFNKIVDDSSFLSVNRIHPLKQRQVKSIVEVARLDNSVKSIRIFGSSTRYDCDITSDLDICIEWREDCYDSEGVLKPFTLNIRKAIASITQGKSDVVNANYLSGTEIEDDAKNGVLVYEYNV